MQQVLRVAEIVLRVDERLADRLLVGEGGDRLGLGQQPNDVEIDLVGLARTRIEGRQRRDHRRHDHHRMGRGGKPIEEVLERLVNQAVTGQIIAKSLELLRRGQMPVDEKKADLHERGRLRHLLDRIAAVPQDPLLPVDEGDGADAGAGVSVRRVHIVRDVETNLM